MKNRLLVLIVFLVLLSTGCTTPGYGSAAQTEDLTAPVYERKTKKVELAAEYNPYKLAFTENGVFYYALEDEQVDEEAQWDKDKAEDARSYSAVYRFYYSPYDGGEKSLITEMKDGYVRDFAGEDLPDGGYLSALWVGEEVHITKWDEKGKEKNDLHVDDMFANMEKMPVLLPLSGGRYAVAMERKVYLIGEDGIIEKEISLDGEAKELLKNGDDEVFVMFEAQEGMGTVSKLARLEMEKGRQGKTRSLQDAGSRVFLLQDGVEDQDEAALFVVLSKDYAYAFHLGDEKEECLIDFEKQGILCAGVQGVFGDRDHLKLAVLDQADLAQGLLLFGLTLKGDDTEADKEQQKASEGLYTEDGRRIVRIAVSKEYPYLIERHATKYNQLCDDAFVEVERFDSSAEDYLGKGNRPDLLVLEDHMQITEFAEKGIPADLYPLFEAQEKYSTDDLIDGAKAILEGQGNGALYAMAGRFRLLLHSSDGSEYDAKGHCTTGEYLKWYDEFLEKNRVQGMGSLEMLLYADLASFYDETVGEAYFESDAFKKLMTTYRETLEHHRGAPNYSDCPEEIDKKIKIDRVTTGPFWRIAYCLSDLTVPGQRMEAMPTADGKGITLMRLEYPLMILDTCDCRSQAFDFMMYYCSLSEYCWIAMEDSYGKGHTTEADFSVFKENLRQEIYETEEPFYASRTGDFYYTAEHKEQLEKLIDEAVPDTRTRQEIFKMLTEEMAGYLHGEKTLESACGILQNRASLYLSENRN